MMEPTIPPAPKSDNVAPSNIYPEPVEHRQPLTNDHRDGLKSIFSTIGLLLLAPILAIFITTFVFHSYEVYGESMEPTMNNGDRLLVLKAPRTWASLRGNTYMPGRGEIIVFNKPDLSVDNESGKQLIKRVIGLPGDRVMVSGGTIKIFNNEHPNGYSVDADTDYGSTIPATEGDINILVPQGEVFVCGDNRLNSLDSRYFGTIRTKDIVGTAEFRMYPFGQQRSF